MMDMLADVESLSDEDAQRLLSTGSGPVNN
jgi:hypothetical protein